MSAILKTCFMSLNEAVTVRAFGVARTSSDELTRRIAIQHQLRDLIIRCQAEAKRRAKHRGFPKQLPYWPVPHLIELLEAHRMHWPPSAAELHACATQLQHDSAEKRYKEELDQLFSRASSGKLVVVGRTGEHPGSPVVRIDPDHFLGNVTIDHTLRHIGPSVGNEENPTPGSILQSASELLPIYYYVMVKRKDLGRLPPQPHCAQVGQSALKKINEWYRSERVPLGESRDADQAAARSKFPNVKGLRVIVRALREEYLRPKRGRPKLAKK